MSCSGGGTEKPLPDSITSPAYYLDQGFQHYSQNNYAQAIDNFNRALTGYRSIDNLVGITQSCLNLANSYMAINNNEVASEYLDKANLLVTDQTDIEIRDHLHLLNSTLAIKNKLHERALSELSTVLNSPDNHTKLAALKNRTIIAFMEDASDRSNWLKEYEELQKITPDSQAHLAHIYRLQATLNSDIERRDQLLEKSLGISRTLANRPAIAATLTQWADTLAQTKTDDAEDKYLRALFIRHQLGDVTNTLEILKKLDKVYQQTGDDKQQNTSKWIDALSQHPISNWSILLVDFDDYPKPAQQ